jgi:pilus assembly protein CpaC
VPLLHHGARRALLTLLLSATAVLPAWAQSAVPPTAPPPTGMPLAAPRPVAEATTAVTGSRLSLTLSVGAGRVITLSQPATSLFAADPKVAEVRPASPTSLFVFGVAPGKTTIAALADGGAPVAQIEVTVRPSAYGSNEVAGLVRSGLGTGIDVKATPEGYTVTGVAHTPADAERVVSALRPYLGPGQNVDNRIQVETPLTVNLRVRIVEIDRTVTRELGMNWTALLNKGLGGFAFGLSQIDRVSQATNLPDTFALGYTGSQGSVNAVIDALAQDQLAVVLAEPNLTAQSGETASFLAGGEYPIPVSQQNNTITIDYKQYGVSLAFVPTVLSADRISLKVRPEVSQLTTEGAVAITSGNLSLNIPALTVRRAETTVELGSGQSFAIAGLLSDNSTQNARGIPLLGELPVLGALFRSNAYQRGQTELVIVVTPYLVRPVSDPTSLVVPSRGFALPNDLERILYNRQRARGNEGPPTAHIPLDAGFILP